AAEGKILREADETGAGAAAEALASALGPRREPDRLAHGLAAARACREDGDDGSAAFYLLDVVESSGSATPAQTAPALLLLARIARDRDDVPALEAIVRRAERDVPDRAVERLELLDLAGLVALAHDDLARAER